MYTIQRAAVLAKAMLPHMWMVCIGVYNNTIEYMFTVLLTNHAHELCYK